jgi:hypothetical protein
VENTRVTIEIRQSVWTYDSRERESWFTGERSGHPKHRRLKFWRGKRATNQKKYQFGETFIATALMRRGYMCWTWFVLFGEATNSRSRKRNGDEIRQLLVKSGRVFDPQRLGDLVRQELPTFRAPDVVAYDPSHNLWRFIEAKLSEKTVRRDQQLSLAIAQYFLNVQGEVIHLHPGEVGAPKAPLRVLLPFQIAER